MALNLKPIAGSSNRVIVEPAAAEEKTASGLYIPDTAKEKPSKGTVVSVSEEDTSLYPYRCCLYNFLKNTL